VNFRALLDDEGDLQIEHYDREKRSFWRKESVGARLADFTLIRRHLTGGIFAPNEAREKLTADCGLRSVVPDPWFGIGMGLNQEGELVVGGLGNGACLSAGPKKYKELKFQTRRADQGRSRQERSNGVKDDASQWDRIRFEASGFGEVPGSTRSVLWVREQSGVFRPLLPYDY
jgi:hypothetical protein